MKRFQQTAVVFALTCVVYLMTGAAADAQTKPSVQPGPAAETGTIIGTVFDSQSGNGVRGASVEVAETRQVAATDIDGKYILKLPAGKYTLRVSADNYFDQPVADVLVAARSTIYIDPVLVPKSLIADEKVIVTADSVQTASIKSALLERQIAETIVDNVSAEDISRNPDGDAAAVLERVTGISVLQDKYVYVRGLGERYSSTMLNGSMIPSTEPEKKVIAFDLFPASLINRISAVKSYTPDQPGDFSGALVKVDTVEFPAEFIMKYSASVGFNTNVSAKTFKKYRGSHLDWTGYGYGSRQTPDDYPDERITKKSDITGSGFAPEELQYYGRELPNEWEARDGKAAPDLSQSFTTGGTYKNLGAIFSMTYGRKFSRQIETVNSFQALNGNLIPWNLFTNDKNTETVKNAFVGNLSYKISKDHKLLLKNFYTLDSGDETRFLYGFSNGNTADERDTRLRYLTERISTTQGSGQHFLRPLGNSLLEWRMAYSRAFRGEPDLRETIYRSEQGKNDYYFSPEGQSGFRQFSDQHDKIYEPGVDWSFFLIRGGFNATLKFGGLYQHRLRDFSSRRFVFMILDRRLDLRQSPEQLFQPANIAPDKIELREITRFTDTFDAKQDVYAGYAMADVVLSQKWRFLGGLRYERSLLRLNTYDPYAPAIQPLVTALDNSDPLPAASVVYRIRPSMNLRAGFSRTLNRPEFRELAPFQFTDISGRSTIIGNPNLQQAKINNGDVRWEWFPGGSDLYAASVFTKRFYRPIERVLFYAADVLTSFANIDGATSKGIELEMKKGLEFLSGRLANFTVGANYSLIDSNVQIGDIQGLVMTSKQRPLQGQSRYLFNTVLDYENSKSRVDIRVLYNLVGSRITEVGATQLPDVYEQPNHFLDVSFGKRFTSLDRMQFKFAATNLLNRPITHLQGGQVYTQYKLGRSFSMGVSFDIY